MTALGMFLLAVAADLTASALLGLLGYALTRKTIARVQAVARAVLPIAEKLSPLARMAAPAPPIKEVPPKPVMIHLDCGGMVEPTRDGVWCPNCQLYPSGERVL